MYQKISYAVGEIRAHWGDERWFRNRLAQRINGPVYDYRMGPGVDVPSEPWDNLLVLDACRADLFEEVVDTTIFDEYSRVISKASATPEWVQKNWANKAFGDVVYVNANPYVTLFAPDSFHRLVDVWQEDFSKADGTVLPETLTKHAQRAFQQDKRLVAHYIQPHHPFYTSDDFAFTEEAWVDWVAEEADRPSGTTDPWKALDRNEKTREQVWRAYRENLKLGFAQARSLATSLPGRTVITSDHGNLLGELTGPIPVRQYGHPRKLRHPNLVSVPWGVISGTRRKTIDEGVSTTDTSEAEMKEQLSSLGYLD